MRKLLKFFLKLLLILVLFAGILFITSKLLEQKIVQKAVQIMNSKIDVPVFTDEITFSLLKKFPEATLQLKNLTLLSSKDFNKQEFDETFVDTLIHVQDVYLSISLISLYHDILEIDKAYVQNGSVNLLTDKEGKSNYDILKKLTENKTPVEADSHFAFLLNQIQFRQMKINFINKFKKTAITLNAPNYTVKGNFYKNDYTASSSGKLLVTYFEQGRFKISPDDPVNLIMNLNVKNNRINIVNSRVQKSNLGLAINGNIVLTDPIDIDVKVNGQFNSLDELLGMVGVINMDYYRSKGALGLSAIIKGKLSNTESPAVAANFKLINGELQMKNQNVNLDNIILEGSFSNGSQRNLSSTQLEIKQFFLATENSSIKGTLSIQDFNKPYIILSSDLQINLTDVEPWINSSGFSVGGTLKGTLNCQGFFNPAAENLLIPIGTWQKKGEFSVTDGFFTLKKPELNIGELSGQVKIENNELHLQVAKSMVQNSNVEASLHVDDYLSPLVDSTYPVNVLFNLNADKVEYEQFKQFFDDDESDTPGREVNYTGTFKTNNLLYVKLVAQNVVGSLDYRGDKLQITNLSAQTMEGSVQGNLNYIYKTDNNYIFQTQATTKRVNIKTLFSTFDNFNQKFIVDENIEGNLSSNFDLEMEFENDKVMPSSIELLGHARIDNGKLEDFKPIMEVSKFADIQELKNVEFLTLENDILISNSTINIPKMEIASNAFDISVYGDQKFNGDYMYHLKVNLSDFIGGKTKRLAKQQSEFGYVEDDGYGKKTLFLLAKCENDKSKVTLDGDAIKSNIKTELHDEKTEFKKALHDEFGWFKKDSTLAKPQKKKKPEFVIEWDDE